MRMLTHRIVHARMFDYFLVCAHRRHFHSARGGYF